jgi:hypothetical protein
MIVQHAIRTLAAPLGSLALVIAAAQPAGAVATRTVVSPVGEAPEDQFGTSVSGAGDLNGDGYADVIVGAFGNDAGGIGAGRAYVYFGGPGADEEADLTLTGEAALDQFGRSVSGAGDVNGDGYADVIVSAPVAVDVGRAYVYFGMPGADEVADLVVTGDAVSDLFGTSVAGAGDVNGDGYADVIVGAPLNDAGGSAAGRSYVYHGGPVADATVDLVLTGEATGDYFGNSVAGAGDVNGDGYGDVIVGAPLNDAGGFGCGRAYVYYGGPAADEAADLVLTGEAIGDNFGNSVAGTGDVNGDGYGDVAVGANGADAGGMETGRAYVYHGGSAPDAVADLVMTGEAEGDYFGYSVSGAGDVNGDGYDDVIAGANENDAGGPAAGRAYVFHGGPGADAMRDVIFTGDVGFGAFGNSVCGAGDVTGDGFGDVIVGAPGGAGRAYVIDHSRYFLTSPNGGETWPVGSLQSVSWLGDDLADIWLSADGGFTFERVRDRVGGGADNMLALRVPHVPTRFALVKVTPSDPALRGQDLADSLFTIETSVSLLAFKVEPGPSGGAELTWSTHPEVGPQGIAGYRLYRSEAGTGYGYPDRPIGPSLIVTNSFVDDVGSPGSSYRLTAVNGLGEELELGRATLAPQTPLVAWPLPYRDGDLFISFAVFGRLGATTGNADVTVYDVVGRRVRELARGTFEGRQQVIRWDGRDDSGRRVANGVYLLRLRSGGEAHRLRIVVAR